jgi:biopolymer transport protein ExbD
VSLDELRTQLTAAKAGTPDLPVVVKGDTVVQYGKVMEVLDLLGQVGITQMGLVTQKLAK